MPSCHGEEEERRLAESPTDASPGESLVKERGKGRSLRVGPDLHCRFGLGETKTKGPILLLRRVWIVIWMGFFAGVRMSVVTRRRSDDCRGLFFLLRCFVLLD